MKSASILLALIVVLGFVKEAGAEQSFVVTDHEYLIGDGTEQERLIGNGIRYVKSCYGFCDGRLVGQEGYATWSKVYFDWREFDVPFTATQGLIGFCCILATLIIVPVVLTVRWKKKRATN